MNILPNHKAIHIQALSRIFERTTTSYKYLFFQSILSLLKGEKFKKSTFTFEELRQEMLSISAYPIEVFKLRFGSQDEISNVLDGGMINIVKYVPYRLLTPFFSQELKGLSDYEKNSKIESLSNEENEYFPIYAIEGDKIIIYPEWLCYFKTHYSIIEGWAFWHWVNYLQTKNPNVLSLVHKLQKPSVRRSLKNQTDYWKVILDIKPVKCIFSGDEIQVEDFSLDHFLPWSYIGHDQLWNLIPISQSVNSSKSNNIPSMNKYLDNFIDIQVLGLDTSHHEMSKIVWNNHVDDFVLGLHLECSDLALDKELVRNKYKELVTPLADIAGNMGFDTHWTYKN